MVVKWSVVLSYCSIVDCHFSVEISKLKYQYVRDCCTVMVIVEIGWPTPHIINLMNFEVRNSLCSCNLNF